MSFHDPGTLSIVSGRMGAGKTDWALKMCEYAMKKKPHIKIISNIGMMKPVKNYLFCNTLTALLEAMIKVKEGILVLDEAGIFGSSGASRRQKDNGQWEQFAKLSRKFGLATIWIDQRVTGSVLPTIRDLARYRFHKRTKFELEIYEHGDDIDQWLLVDRIRLTSEDRTRLPFDTLDIGSFEMDLPDDLTIRDVFNYLSKFRSSEVRTALKGWLNKIQTETSQTDMAETDIISEGKRPRLTKRDVIIFLLDLHQPKKRLDYPRNKDLLKILDVSDQYVREVKKEWFAKNEK